MKKRLCLMGLYICLLIAPSLVMAQTEPDCPVSRDATVVVQGAELYRNRQRTGPSALVFGQRLRTAPLPGTLDRDDDRLIQAMGGDTCGFIQANHVLTQDEKDGLRVSDLYRDSDSERDQNPLRAKVIVRNEPKEGQPFAEGKGPIVQAYTGPGANYAKHDTIRLYEILRVFKAARGNDDQSWYLVGTSRQDLIGWLPEKEVIEWSHREVVYPAKGREKIPIYETDRLDEYGQPMQDLYRVDETKRAVATSRMPLLYKCGTEGREGGSGCPEPLYSVVTITDSWSTDGGEVETSTGQDLTDLRAQLADAVRSAGNVDVLFVIDNTESMTRYRKPILDGVGDAIATIVDRVASSENLNGQSLRPRFAFAAYGDYLALNLKESVLEARSPDTWLLLDELSAANIEPFQIEFLDFGGIGQFPTETQLESLIGENSFSDPHDDYPEAGFAALVAAVNGASWRKDSKMRLVIWVGDDGNRVSEEPSNLSEDRVVTALQQQSAALVSLNVKGAMNDDWNNIFENQAAAIAGKVKASWPPASIRNRSGTDELAVLRQAVDAYISALFDVSKELGNYAELHYRNPIGIQEANSGKEDEYKHRLSYSKWRVEWLEKVTGISDFEKLEKRLRKVSQTVTEGWIRVNGTDGEPQTELYVALRPTELNPLRSAVYQLCLGVDAIDDLKRLMEDALESLVEVVLGDDRSHYYRHGDGSSQGEDLATFFSRILYLPEEAFSLFIGKDLDETIALLQKAGGAADDGRTAEAFAKAICKSAHLLKEIEDGRYIEADWLADDQQDELRRIPTFKIANERHKSLNRDFSWLWGLDKGVTYYFVPINFLPNTGLQ